MSNKFVVYTGVGIAVVIVGAAAAAALGLFSTKVTLSHSEEYCAKTDPPKPEIFRPRVGNSLKPKKAKWVVTSAQKNMYQWKIEYQETSANDPSKQGTGDYLGPVDDILCTGSQSTKSKKAPKGSGDVDWPYRIRVYDCEGEWICDQDPIIWIQN